ncbi:molybdenum cofactor guanylyltransferase MobA [Aliivibrio fischeri]|uniref:molybdenum cofactor guanylyltransferase MobA n=1 Tax=Aliivibrio fischeri TaxID=668 RepID=UPI00080E6C5F|nr:molybdenum cofactor guanylyltransferase MobA [Aliivibrio fischeri]MUJ23658.1 molybdenum cofactor guanylyltransferase MobA [Aliivibrio fischeri]MUK25785.1 molybdenum cofactor guanylyltransferase MobA [Aliivibrio fischeri]MUK34250.1 molybdenum cofactor guanylyltransferase MobA [Aliivibrio fischeri]MUL10466.1 molybdenum cofactor guanylyltransferase MobA [Aliivibrio fischeri]MUL12605.1 molybdenum cofactor guanylyltransferase MobA [Aliivibrio fischeri]
MLQPKQTSWVILAGGQARRMGGKDKGFVLFQDKPLIEHALDTLTSQTDQIAINANRSIEEYSRYGVTFPDQFSEYPGPLAGMHSGLVNMNSDWVGFIPCDSPNLPSNLVSLLCNAVKEDTDIVVAHDGEYMQPVVTLMHKRIIPKIDAFLTRGDRKIILLYKECNTVFADFSDYPNAFINLNSPQELEQFGTLL